MNPQDLATGEAQAKVLNTMRAVLCPRTLEPTLVLERLDWQWEQHPQYKDRLIARQRINKNYIDLSHTKLIDSYGKALWEPISIPPVYLEIPEKEKLYSLAAQWFKPELCPIGTKLIVLEDLKYYGEVVPKGTEIIMVGYKTTLDFNTYPSLKGFGFEPTAKFPDGTYRSLPRGNYFINS